MSDPDLSRCRWMKTDEDDRDPDGCEECDWETWRCHNAAIEAATLLAGAQTVVDEQAEDEGLWFIAATAPEAYLQQELRRLHAAIDPPGDTQ